MRRVEGKQNFRIVDDVGKAHGRDNDEPQSGHRREKLGDAGGSSKLDSEKRGQDRERDRHDITIENGIYHLQAFDGRQHRNGRRDHGIAEEKCRPDDSEQQREAAATSSAHVRPAYERQDSALALVVGPHQQKHVFEGDETMSDQISSDTTPRRRCAESRSPCEMWAERFAKRVERARADVAEDDANASEHQPQPRRLPCGCLPLRRD